MVIYNHLDYGFSPFSGSILPDIGGNAKRGLHLGKCCHPSECEARILVVFHLIPKVRQLPRNLRLAHKSIESNWHLKIVLHIFYLLHNTLWNKHRTRERRSPEKFRARIKNYRVLCNLIIEPVDLKPTLTRINNIDASQCFSLLLQTILKWLSNTSLRAINRVNNRNLPFRFTFI